MPLDLHLHVPDPALVKITQIVRQIDRQIDRLIAVFHKKLKSCHFWSAHPSAPRCDLRVGLWWVNEALCLDIDRQLDSQKYTSSCPLVYTFTYPYLHKYRGSCQFSNKNAMFRKCPQLVLWSESCGQNRIIRKPKLTPPPPPSMEKWVTFFFYILL